MKRLIFFTINGGITSVAILLIALFATSDFNYPAALSGVAILVLDMMIGWALIGVLAPFSNVKRWVPMTEMERVRDGLLINGEIRITDYRQVKNFDDDANSGVVETRGFNAYGFECEREYRVDIGGRP